MENYTAPDEETEKNISAQVSLNHFKTIYLFKQNSWTNFNVKMIWEIKVKEINLKLYISCLFQKTEIEGMTYYLPKQNNLLLTLFVGDFNVVLPRKEDKIK